MGRRKVRRRIITEVMWRWSRRVFCNNFFVCNKGLFSWKLNGVNESKVRMEIRRSKNGGQSRETDKHKEKRSKNKWRTNGDDRVTIKY